MSGTFPSAPGPSAVTLRSSTPSLVSVSQSGRRFVREMSGHRWLIIAAYGPLTRAEARPLEAFVTAQRGQSESFQFVAPQMAPRGVATGAPLVNGAGQTGRSVVTDGWTASVTGILRAGDVLKFGHSKVYIQTVDVNSNALGQVTLTLEPPLIISPPDNDPLTVNNVPFTVAFAADVQEFPVRPPMLYSYEASMMEVY